MHGDILLAVRLAFLYRVGEVVLLQYPMQPKVVNEWLRLGLWHTRCVLEIYTLINTEATLRIALLIFLVVFPLNALAQERSRTVMTDRGKYIVEHVAMCAECHTPRDMNGNLQTGAYLQGGPVLISPPPFPNVRWALQAPAIAGLTAYSEQQAVRLLMDGTTIDGRRLRAPMPRFRMNRGDAEAVVAYLKSLNR